MLEKTLQKYLVTLGAETYSIIIISLSGKIEIMSNIPGSWAMEFIKRKIHVHSCIIHSAKERIIPFLWSSTDINSEDIRYLSMKYNIHAGITFTIKVQQVVILFTIYLEKGNERIISIFNKKKEYILYEILRIFEQHYKTEPRCKFTRREYDVVNLLKTGKTYNEIALILDICERTVRFHINNILLKLDVTSVKYAIFKATSEGLI